MNNVKHHATNRQALEANLKDGFAATDFRVRENLVAVAQVQAILELADAYRERTALMSPDPDDAPAKEGRILSMTNAYDPPKEAS